jgi:3-methyl-2-oxobutanoate hydroxymethyltransferase
VSKLTVPALQAMKREGRKIVAVVCWDPATAEVADAHGVELVSVGDSVVVSFEELLVFCSAVRRGVKRALLSCDLPEPTVDAARQLVAEGGADLVKVEGVDNVRVIAAAEIPVFAQIETASEAKEMEEAGAALLDFRHSGPEAGGLGGGPWLDGRVRAVHRLLDDALAAYAGDVRAGRPVKGD